MAMKEEKIKRGEEIKRKREGKAVNPQKFSNVGTYSFNSQL